MHKKSPVIFLAAGGTGGHLFPAQSVAEALRNHQYTVHMITDKRGLHFSGELASIPVHHVHAATLKPGLLGKIKAVLSLGIGLLQSVFLLARYRPALCIGFGGYPSFPMIKAAQLLRQKTIIHEANAVLGVANKMLARGATAIATSLPAIQGVRPKDAAKITVTGNPVRAAILKAGQNPYRPYQKGDDFRLFVTGGSQGAKIFGQVIPAALKKLPLSLQQSMHVVQQCRRDDETIVRTHYAGFPGHVTIAPFFDTIAELMANAHLIICRSGASTVSEIAVIGRPAIFVPLTVHADQQQRLNAAALVDRDAGLMMLENELTADALAEKIENLMHNPTRLDHIATQAKACGQGAATDNMIKLVESLCTKG